MPVLNFVINGLVKFVLNEHKIVINCMTSVLSANYYRKLNELPFNPSEVIELHFSTSMFLINKKSKIWNLHLKVMNRFRFNKRKHQSKLSIRNIRIGTNIPQ